MLEVVLIVQTLLTAWLCLLFMALYPDSCGLEWQMELDTGATVSIMSQQKFASLFPSTQIPRSKVTLQTYTGEPMKVLGEVPVQVTYQQQPTQDLQLVVVEGNGLAPSYQVGLDRHQSCVA